MKDEDVKQVRDYIAGRFKEVWDLSKQCIGTDADAPWEAILEKSGELTGTGWLTESQYSSLNWQKQVDIAFGRFLSEMTLVEGRINHILRKADGEDVKVRGVSDEL